MNRAVGMEPQLRVFNALTVQTTHQGWLKKEVATVCPLIRVSDNND